MQEPICPKCRAQMTEGFLMDMSRGYTGVAHWVGGPPEASFWTGVKVGDKPNLPVRTYRCEKCGYLESYA